MAKYYICIHVGDFLKSERQSQCNLNDFNVDGSKVNIPYNLDYPTQLSFISPELIPGPILSTQAQ